MIFGAPSGRSGPAPSTRTWRAGTSRAKWRTLAPPRGSATAPPAVQRLVFTRKQHGNHATELLFQGKTTLFTTYLAALMSYLLLSPYNNKYTNNFTYLFHICL